MLELTELHNFKSPEGAKVFSYKTLDGISLRVSIWNKDSKKGSLLLQSGRTEFTEKYFEVIDEFLQRDLCVAMFDWRGQGLSDRLTKNRFIGHVNDFSDYARSSDSKKEEIEIVHLLQEGVDLFSNMNHGSRIEIDIKTDLPKIYGDEKKLRQVLNNLLTNAIDANAMGHDNSLKISL